MPCRSRGDYGWLQRRPFAACTAWRGPIIRITGSEVADRLWTDINGDGTVFNPDGTVQDSEFNSRYPEATSEIGAPPSGSIFGQLRPQTTIIDPGPNEGWFKRQYNWEFSGTLQHQVMNGVAASLTYWKRTRAGNEPSVDNINIGPQDFDGRSASERRWTRASPMAADSMCAASTISSRKHACVRFRTN